MEIFFNTISETFNNTFVGTLIAGLTLAVFTVKYIYRKQKSIDSSVDTHNTIGGLSVKIKRKLKIMSDKKNIISERLDESISMREFTDEENTTYWRKRIRPVAEEILDLLSEMEEIAAGTNIYSSFEPLLIKYNLMYKAYFKISMQVYWQGYNIPIEEVSKLSKEFDTLYPEIIKHLDSYIAK